MASPEKSASIAIAECESFAGKMPAFLVAIATCMVAQIIVFYGKAPFFISTAIPLAIATLALVRARRWIVRRRRPFSPEEAVTELRRAKSLLFGSTMVVIPFDVVLFQYVDDWSRYFLILSFFGGTMAAVYSLMNLRAAAYFIVAALLGSMFFTLRSLPGEIAIGTAVMLASLTGAMVRVMQSYHRDFLTLIGTKIEAQALNEQNFRLAGLDMLTEMPNRRRFFADLGRLHAEARRERRRLAVAIADLDGFKPINDTYGHTAGDRVLTEVAARLGQDSRVFQHAYRLGGDEFALIAENAPDDTALKAAGAALIASVGEPITLGEVATSTGCSVGIAVYPDSAGTPDLLYERADYALYHAKRSGRNRAVGFSREHEELLRRHGTVEQALRNADLETELHLVYQPIVRAGTGRVLGFECLARWTSPTLGPVSPGIFVPVAEQSGLIANLTPILLRKALADAANWPDDVRVSFNLSPHDVASRERVLRVIAIIAQSDVSPARIDIELTETALLHNYAEAVDSMAALKAIGVSISLDDFGTGYSSLNHVHALPLDKIKIDRSFVHGVESSPATQMILRAMIGLCRDLDLVCIVEGVETQDELDTIRGLGCELIQGYLFARPMASCSIPAYLAERRRAA